MNDNQFKIQTDTKGSDLRTHNTSKWTFVYKSLFVSNQIIPVE